MDGNRGYTVKYKNDNVQRILGACLAFASVLMLFFGFIGIGFLDSSASPVLVMAGCFSLISLGGSIALIAILYILLFLATVVLSLLTGIFALVNRKYFSALWGTIAYSVLALLFLVVGLLGNSMISSLSAMISTQGLGLSTLGLKVMPTLYLFIGWAMAIAPVFLIRKVKEPIYGTNGGKSGTNGGESGTNGGGNGSDDDDKLGGTIRGTKPNNQGIEVQVKYTDDTGYHVVTRQITTDRPMTVGRANDCSLSINDTRASSRHASLVYDDLNGMVIEDNGSTNGVQVNGETIMKKRRIDSSDTVRLGDCKLQFKVLGHLDRFNGEETLPSTANYHEPVSIRLLIDDETGRHNENILLKERATIGRDQGCEVHVISRSVSHRHAYLRNMGKGKVCIEDNMSQNSTLINGEKVAAAEELKSGDVLTLGDVRIKVTLD